ncbi:MAG TPA: DMT family transporter [Candidatus Heimdallarchaeota archaeon]|nr:DMT family transporter [Candidatus Heimdallarchaeota archaeon]
MVFTALFWAGSFIAGKVAVAEVPPFTVAFLRFLVAGAILLPFALRQEGFPRPGWRGWLWLIAAGAVGICGYHALFFWGLRETSASTSSLIVALNPLFTALLAVALFKEGFSLRHGAGFFLAIVGIALITTEGKLGALFTGGLSRGDLLTLGATLTWSGYTLIVRVLSSRFTPLTAISWASAVGTVLLLPLSLYERPCFSSISLPSWGSILYMGILPSALGYLIYNHGLARLGVRRSTAFIYLVPVFTLLLAQVMLHEAITLVKGFGAVAVLTGVYLAKGKSARKSASKKI